MRLGASGAVLAGGASRRMGTDKAVLRRDGRTLARRASDDLAGAGLAPVAVIGHPAPATLDLAPGTVAVADRYPGEGPLGGLLTALEWSPEARCVVVPCDVVHWDGASLIPMLVRAATGADVAVLATATGPEPLYGCWCRTAVPALTDAFAAGTRAPRDLLPALRAVYVEVGPGELPVSVNDPAEAVAAGVEDGPAPPP